VVACSGTKELWSNAKLIYNEEKLWEIFDNHSSTIWIIAAADQSKSQSKTLDKMPKDIRAISKKISQRYIMYRYKTSVDGMIDVYKIDPAQRLGLNYLKRDL
jgi:hypothetical protein